MNIQVEDIVLEPISVLKPNPKNPNHHTPEQIQRLAKIIEYQGFRQPIIVSDRTGLIVVGHGRLEAAKLLGLEKVPVSYQSFDDHDQEYAFLVADNAIAEWSDLDLSAINAELENFDPAFELDQLGLEDFKLDPAEKYQGTGGQPSEPTKALYLSFPADIYDHVIRQLDRQVKDRGLYNHSHLVCELIGVNYVTEGQSDAE
jgi:ParB-like chromosome segregation protein Spo0J